MKPMVEVVQGMLDGQAERYGNVVDGLPEDALNWQPGNAETNSVAQLVRHVTAVQNVLLGRALGESPEHDHAHSLRNDPATKEELHGLIAAAKAQKDDQLTRLDGDGHERESARPARPHAPRALCHSQRRPRAGASRPRRTDEAVVGAARSITLRPHPARERADAYGVSPRARCEMQNSVSPPNQGGERGGHETRHELRTMSCSLRRRSGIARSLRDSRRGAELAARR